MKALMGFPPYKKVFFLRKQMYSIFSETWFCQELVRSHRPPGSIWFSHPLASPSILFKDLYIFHKWYFPQVQFSTSGIFHRWYFPQVEFSTSGIFFPEVVSKFWRQWDHLLDLLFTIWQEKSPEQERLLIEKRWKMRENTWKCREMIVSVTTFSSKYRW